MENMTRVGLNLRAHSLVSNKHIEFQIQKAQLIIHAIFCERQINYTLPLYQLTNGLLKLVSPESYFYSMLAV